MIHHKDRLTDSVLWELLQVVRWGKTKHIFPESSLLALHCECTNCSVGTLELETVARNREDGTSYDVPSSL